MSEFLDNEIGEPQNKPDEPEEDNTEQQGVPTDVKGVYADSMVKQGHNEFPVFKCNRNDFYNNMTDNRKKMRFQSGSDIQQYMQKTKYNKPFFVSYTDSSGKTFKRRVK